MQRATLHRVIPGNYPTGARRGIRTTVFGEKRKSDRKATSSKYQHDVAFYDPKSEGRLERVERLVRGKKM